MHRYTKKSAQMMLEGTGVKLLFLTSLLSSNQSHRILLGTSKTSHQKKKIREKKELDQAWFQALQFIDPQLTHQYCIKHSTSYNINYD